MTIFQYLILGILFENISSVNLKKEDTKNEIR